MQIAQAVNPLLPSFEYLSAGEARIFDGKLYLYGSHDKFNGKKYGANDYVCWSTDVDDPTRWQYEGVIFERKQIPKSKDFKTPINLFSPDVVKGTDGKFYLFFAFGFQSRIGVAVSDAPHGKFTFLDCVRYADGTPFGAKGEPLLFDPAVLVDDDGQSYLYAGFCSPLFDRLQKSGENNVNGCMGIRLNADMVTVNGEISYVLPNKNTGEGTGFDGNEFLKAPSVRKFGKKYFITYTSTRGYEICYGEGNKPLGAFSFGGKLLSLGDAVALSGGAGNQTEEANAVPLAPRGDVQGCIEKIGGDFFLFYHRHTNGRVFSRQVCAEKLTLNGKKFLQAETTSCGLNGRPLAGVGEYKARIACHLFNRRGAKTYTMHRGSMSNQPYLTQTGRDRTHTPSQHVANCRHGSTVGFRYFEFDGANQIIVTIKGNPQGKLIVSETPDGRAVAKIRLTPCKDFTDFYAPLHIQPGVRALYFNYEGMGKFIFKAFTLQQVSRGNKYD